MIRLALALVGCAAPEPEVAIAEVAIASPIEGQQFLVGEAVTLQAVPTRGEAPADAVWAWSSSLDGPIGEGATATWAPVATGHHGLTVTVTQGERVVEDSVAVWVREPPPDLGSVTIWDAQHGLPDVTWRGLVVSGDRAYGATDQGLVVVDGDEVRVLGVADGLLSDDVHSVEIVGEEVWIGFDAAEGGDGQRLDAALIVVGTLDVGRSGEVVSLHRIREVRTGPRAGDVWFGTNEGLVVWPRGQDGPIEHLHPVHPHGDTLGVAFTDDGEIWNGDAYQLSRWWYGGETSLSSSGNLVDYAPVWPVEAEQPVWIADADASGDEVWVASASYGLARVDGSDGGVSAGVAVPGFASALAVRLSVDGVAWVGTPEGCFVVDVETGEVTAVGGAWMPGPAVRAIAVDDTTTPATVWLGTDGGLVRVVGVEP